MASNNLFETDEAQDRDQMVLKLRVSLKGRPIKTLSFVKDEVTIGRDPNSDVALDNPGISRDHLRLERAPHGYVAEDLTSANGTYVNDELIESTLLQQDDIIRVGKFSLWVAYEHGSRGSSEATPVSPNIDQGTTVLSTDELQKMMTKLKTFDDDAPAHEESVVGGPELQKPVSVVRRPVFNLVIGSLFGAAVFWLVTNYLL